MLVIYEAGVLWFGAQNGAAVFMQSLLRLLGFSQHFLLPVLTVCTLLAWHHLARQPWRVSGGVISGMAAESIFLGLGLWFVSLVWITPAISSVGDTLRGSLGPLVALLGAGIYEELLFRLILLSLLAWALRRAGATPSGSMLLAVLASSLLFAAAHHVGRYGEPFVLNRFLFRSVAGAFFSVAFVYRGFGIAAGAHAAYDVIATVL